MEPEDNQQLNKSMVLSNALVVCHCGDAVRDVLWVDPLNHDALASAYIVSSRQLHLYNEAGWRLWSELNFKDNDDKDKLGFCQFAILKDATVQVWLLVKKKEEGEKGLGKTDSILLNQKR